MSFKGEKNVYICRTCGHGFATIDCDEGVTPFMTECKMPNCSGMAQSFCYRVPHDLTPAYEWYRPEPNEIDTLTAHTADHVHKGGLLLREIKR